MGLGRRELLTASALMAVAAPAASAAPRRGETSPQAGTRAAALTFSPVGPGDQTSYLQAAIDRAANERRTLYLPSGQLTARRLEMRRGVRILGEPGKTVLNFQGASAGFFGEGADGTRLEALTIVGDGRPVSPDGSGLLNFQGSRDITLRDLDVRAAGGHAISVAGCSGRIVGNDIANARRAAIFSIDAAGLEISGNRVADCADNGILVWRSRSGEDGTIVSGNTIERIGAKSGGSGQHGNGINVFRAGGVMVTGNRIVDCAYSAVRANAASNVQIVSNQCGRLGEVALYAEFGFEGALIANNIVDGAATGISVTNFNNGGRLAVVQGNLVRNLRRREYEPVDKRGEGIAVEADAVVSNNVIEGAPTAGLVIGWGPHMRDVVATSNVIRQARVGIMITADPGAGSCLVAQNLIYGATDGAIRAMNHGRPFGPDLARAGTTSARVTLSGNVAT